MISAIYRSRPVASFLIVLMVFFVCNTAYPQAGSSNEKKADKAFSEGLDLYKAGGYVKAIERFSQVIALTKDEAKLAETYFYLSLCNYFLGETDGAEEWAVKSLVIDPGREVTNIYPAGFVELFKKAKRTAGIELEQKRRSEPPKAEPKKVAPVRDPEVEQEPAVVSRAREREGGGGHGGLYFIIGAIVVGGAVAAYFLLKSKKEDKKDTTGSIQISSTPSGAKTYLDGTEKGTTPLTIADVAVGSHAVKLTKEGYRDYQTSVSVEGGKTATVSATLSKHTITVTKPAANALWMKGKEVTIDWATDTSATVGQFFPMSPAGLTGLVSPTRWNFVGGPASAGRGAGYRATGPTDQGVRRGAGQELPGSTGENRGTVGSLREYGPGALRSPWLDSLSRLKGSPARSADQPGPAGGPGKVRALVVTNVKIELYKGGSQVETIASSTTNDGSYTLTVPNTLSNAKNYKIRVSCVDETSVYGESAAFEISAGYGTINVKSTPGGAKIYLDEANTGKSTPATLTKVAAGTHTVKVTKTGYDAEEQTATVTANHTTNVTFTLEGYGSIKVTSTPGAAKVYLDGADSGKKTPCTLTHVVKGSHTVRVVKTSYESQEKSVSVNAGKTANVAFTLKGIGKIHVTSSPSGAAVSLDGTDTGKVTPCTLSDVSAGSHTVKADKDGYETQEKTVNVNPGKTANVAFTLKKSTITIDKPDWWSVWGKAKEVEIKWSTGSSAADWNSLRTERELRGLVPSLLNPLRNDEAARLLARTGGAGSRIGAVTLPDGIGLPELRPGVKVEAPLKTTAASSQPAPPAIANVKIELSKGGVIVKTIVNSTANDGSYSWTVDDTLDDGINYKVIVSDAAGSGASGESQEFALTDVTYVYQTHWGSAGTSNGQFKDPFGICVDKGPYVYVADTANFRIQKFTTTGGWIRKWGGEGTLDGQFECPLGIAADVNQIIFVSDFVNQRVQSFDQGGTYKTKWGSSGAGNGQFNGPYHVAVDPSGYVYVVDYNNNRVQKFWQTGTYAGQWGGLGSGNGKFKNPTGIAIDNKSNVYVVDRGNNRVQAFSTSGAYYSQFGGYGSSDGKFLGPFGVAVDNYGFIYVTDSGNSRVQKFTPRGLFCCKWGSNGVGYGQFKQPTGIAVDSSGNIYVVELGNDRVQKFR